MDLTTLLRIIARRWVVVLVALGFVGFAGYQVVAPITPTYEASGSAVLLRPPRAEAAAAQGHNPYLEFDGSLQPTAGAIQAIVTSPEERRAVSREGLESDYQVGVAATEPVLNVAAASRDPDVAVDTVNAVVLRIGSALDESQEELGTPVEQRATSTALVEATSPEKVEGERSRALTALAAAAVALVLGLSLLVEGTFGAGTARGRSRDADRSRWRRRWRAMSRSMVGERRSVPAAHAALAGPDGVPASREPAKPRSPGGRPGPSPGAGDGTAILVVFILGLVLLPQRTQVSAFAVTGPMVVGVVAGWLWLYGRLLPGESTDRRRHGVTTALLVFVAVAVASYASAQLRPLDVLESQGADRRLTQLVMLAGITLFAADAIRRLVTLRRLAGLLVAVATLNAVVGLLQSFFGFDVFNLTRVFPPRAGFTRPAGLAHHPIDYGVFCAVGLPLALHFAAFGREVAARRWAGLAAGILAIGGVASITRTAWLGLVLGALVLVAGRRGAMRWRPIGLAAVAVFVVALASPSVTSAFSEVALNPGESASIASRTTDYEAVADYVSKSPVIGRGYGTFDPEVFFVLDNSYLKVLVETGIVGFTAFLVLLGSGIHAGRAGRRHGGSESTTDLGRAIAASLVVLAVAAATYDLLFFQLGTGSMVLLLGLAAAFRRTVAEPDVDLSDTAPPAGRPEEAQPGPARR